MEGLTKCRLYICYTESKQTNKTEKQTKAKRKGGAAGWGVGGTGTQARKYRPVLVGRPVNKTDTSVPVLDRPDITVRAD